MKPQTHILHTAPSDDSVSTTFRESTNDITIASLVSLQAVCLALYS